jgi:hypothetical protein
MAEVASDQEIWRVKAVEEMTDTSGRIEYWVIVYEVPETVWPDGEYRYGFPKDALEGRAAEYGLASVDEALEILLWEPLLARASSAGVLQMVVPALLDSDSAREQISDRIARCGELHGVIERTDASSRSRAADPLQAIRDEARLDPVRVATIRMEMDRHRIAQQHLQGRNGHVVAG